MKSIQTILITIFLILIVFVSSAISAITFDPATPALGEPVAITISNTLVTGAASIEFFVDFGDGSVVESSPAYTTPGPNSHTFSHTYSQAGTYTITGTTRLNFALAPVQTSETANIAIAYPIDDLPRGIVGEQYDHELTTPPAPRTNRYRIIRGKFPPSLELEGDGTITGIPAQQGAFKFTVEVSTSRGIRYTRELTLYIDPGTLLVDVTPNPINFTVGGVTSQKAIFRVVAPTIRINETIRSSRAVFLAGNQILGYNNTPLNINLNSDQPSVSETVTVPISVLQAAQDAGTVKITYSRRFTSKNLNPGSGKTSVNMRSGASGELRITRLRIFFEQNNRPIILVERNSRGLTGSIEIHYNGSGTLKGYWKVDERIIERIQKNVFYGNVMTLKTPDVPQLPTFSEGSHRLQFIITEPQTAQANVELPQAIYHVEAKKAEIVIPITLTTPANWAELGSSEVLFSWAGSARTSTYQVEFLEEERDEPFFTAFTTETSYSLLPRLVAMKFTEGKTYSWQVRGFNKAGELTGESGTRQFSLRKYNN